jgi:cytochrome d ubiquinol oxidase subunit II
MKTEGEAHELTRRWILPSIVIFVFCYLTTTVATFYYVPTMTHFIESKPILMVLPVLALAAILSVPYQIKKGRDGWAFISSCISITLLLLLVCFGTYPTIILSTVDPITNSLTIFNTASSQGTLKILLTIAGIGVPLVLCYGFWVYRTFRGKVVIDHKTSY